MDKTEPSLVNFRSILIYPFALGLFNSGLILSFIILCALWFLNYVYTAHIFCRCGPLPAFPSFPEHIHFSVLGIFLKGFILSVFAEAIALGFKSTSISGAYSKIVVFIGWLIRAFLKNFSGLLLLLTLMAQPIFQPAYGIAFCCAVGLLFSSQRGTFQNHVLAFNVGEIWPKPSRNFWRLIYIFSLLYYILTFVISLEGLFMHPIDFSHPVFILAFVSFFIHLFLKRQDVF